MAPNVLLRWEDLREITSGPKRHREAVALWLASRPAVLYWGDSWFSTPLYPNLARQSAWRIDGLRMIVGKPGAQAAELMTARRLDSLVDRIRGNPFDLLVVSAGGNDALSDRLKKVFKPWMRGSPARLSAADAFELLLDDGLFERIAGRYRLLLQKIEKKVLPKRPHFRVVSHGYAPLLRIGQAGALTIPNIGLIAILKNDVGPWLYGPMERVLSGQDEAKPFADLLLGEGFRKQVLETIADEFAGLFSFADLAQVAALADPLNWYDEIHPTGEGFAQAALRLNDELRFALPAAKRAAVR
jgi:hypothetical protein